MNRTLPYVGVLITLVSAILVFHSSSTIHAAPTSPALITSVDTGALAPLLGMDPANATATVNREMVEYRAGRRGVGRCDWFGIGVFPDEAAAHQAFTRLASGTPVGPLQPETPPAGDEFRYWPGREGNNGWPSRCLFRRTNCILSFSCTRTVVELMALAGEVDKQLVSSNALAPKGKAVVIPAVTIVAPATVPVGGMAGVEMRSTAGTPIRVGSSGQSDSLVETACVRFAETAAVGQRTVSLVLATAGNVIFAKEVTIKVVSKEQYALGRPVDWALPEETLYFLADPKGKWEKVPSGDREWIKLARGTFEFLGVAQGKERYEQLAFADLQKTLKPEWLPEPALLAVALDHATAPPAYVAYAHYTRKERGCNIAYLGTTGKEMLLYVEQPYPLAKGATPITVEDILAPSLLAAAAEKHGTTDDLPAMGIQHRTFVRYRALRPQGEYQQVRILLVRIKPEGTLDLRFPGLK